MFAKEFKNWIKISDIRTIIIYTNNKRSIYIFIYYSQLSVYQMTDIILVVKVKFHYLLKTSYYFFLFSFSFYNLFELICK